MKLRRLASLSLLCSAVCCGALRAEPPAAQTTSSSLSADERQRLKTAQMAALKDPAVLAAKAKNDPDALQQAIRATMVRRDPGIAPLLEKAQPSRAKTDEDKGSRYGFLSLGEKEQLRRAHSAAGKDPAVVAARKQLDVADTPAAKEKAEQNLNDATGEAMQRIDPKVAPLLEKIRQRDQAATKAEQ